MEQFVAACRACAPTGSEWCIFLATDDEGAVAPMRQAFGSRLIVREDVKRTDRFDLHMAGWGTLSPADAEDVLIDTLLLARCDVLVHASSSVSTMAGLLNPSMQLIRVTGRV